MGSRRGWTEPNSSAADSMARCSGNKKALANRWRSPEDSAKILDELASRGIGFLWPIGSQKHFIGCGRFGRIRQRIWESFGPEHLLDSSGIGTKARTSTARAFQVAWAIRSNSGGERHPTRGFSRLPETKRAAILGPERIAQFDSMDREDSREFAAPGLVPVELEKEDDESGSRSFRATAGQVPFAP